MPFRKSAKSSPVACLLLALIAVYRATLAYVLGGSCRFHPSCSIYGQQAIRAHGALRGLFLIARRIGRCHPWHPGGLDPVPGRRTAPGTPS